MTSILAPLALTASTGALLALPIAPALREWMSKRDAGPLVTRKDDGRIENFADSLRSRCRGLASSVDLARTSEATGFFEPAGTKIFLSTESGIWAGPKQIDVLVICAAPSQLPAGFLSTDNFYAKRTLRAGENSLFRALLGEEEIVLGDNSRILRWIHAESGLSVGHGCLLFGRASSNKALTLSAGCRFEQMQAPVIYTSSDAMEIPVRTEPAPFSKLAHAGIGRSRVHGKAHLTAGQQHRGDLVVTKTLVMEEDSSVLGSIKANDEVSI
ncbi:MAG TPA: hypothetical protein VM912_05920 [Terriglobales bacterium]|nr:hypothetical protein [Terriglobales bacterium]